MTAQSSFVPGVKDYFTFSPAPYALMVEVALHEKGITNAAIKEKERFIDLPAPHGQGENRCPEILALNPHGTVPFFRMEDGTVINETIAMMEYMDEVMPQNTPTLVGRTEVERAQVRMWQRRLEEHYVIPAYYGHRNWTSSEDCAPDHFMRGFFEKRLNQEHGSVMIPHAWKEMLTWARNRILWLEQVKQDEAKKEKAGRASLYIAGDELRTVDIQVYVTLWFFSEAFPYPPQMILQEDLKGRVPWVQAWYDRMHARPGVTAARESRNAADKAYGERKEKGERAPNDAVDFLRKAAPTSDATSQFPEQLLGA